MNETQSSIERIAGEAGWDSYTLLLLICRRLDESGRAEDMINHLNGLREDDEGTSSTAAELSLDGKILTARDKGYTVNEKAPGVFVFNDPHGNDADNGPWPTQDAAWEAAFDDLETMVLPGEEIDQ